jgi:cytoskeletal protein CcmA (bactofilin family)
MKLGNNFRRDYGKARNDDWQEATDDELEDEDLPEGISSEFPYRPADGSAPESAPKARSRAADDFTSVIGAGSAWKGDFSTEGSVRLDGKTSGNIKASGTVHISEGAEVNANINASYVTIGGTFEGKLVCTDRLELLATSRVNGSITTRLISISEGAVMDGEIHMGSEVKDTPAASTPTVAHTRSYTPSASNGTPTNGSTAEESANGSEEKATRGRGR